MSDDKIIPINTVKSARADAARNRKAIIRAAKRLFKKQGVEAVTMSAIAKAAKVGKGTLYRNFQDKADLCHALLDEDMRDFQKETLEKMRCEDDAHVTLTWFLEQAVRYVDDHINLLREVANQGGIDMITHPAHFWWWQTIRGLLDRLAPAGDINYMTDVLFIMLDVQTIRFQQHAQGYDLERITTGLNDTMQRLIKTT